MERPSNHVLRSLSVDDYELLQPHLRQVALVQSRELFDIGGTIDRVYFPLSGAAISLVVPLQGGQMIEAGIIGQDGVAGTAGALDGSIALSTAIVQIAGPSSVIDTGPIRAAVDRSPSLRSALYRHDQLLLAQAQQSAACNGTHTIDERLCRWLLRARDLVGDHIGLTQEFLSQMLAVRRTSVTMAARSLQSSNLIKYRRGRIEIIDPEGLAEGACECYEAIKLQTKRLLVSTAK